jgi:carbon-monoxide dehydrogenase large subunit
VLYIVYNSSRGKFHDKKRQDIQMNVVVPSGMAVKRREDLRLLTGQACYVDDIKLPGMLYMAVLRSPYGHARIQRIDTTAACSHSKVKGVYTAADLKGMVGNVPVVGTLGAIAHGMGVRPPLAEDKVRFYGDPVAVVVAEDRYSAYDACDLIDVEYEPLPVVVDPEKAMQPDAPLLYENFGSNVALGIHPPEDEIDHIFAQTLAEGGVVVKQRLEHQRLAPSALETRGVVAQMRRADKKLTVWSSSQMPHLLRSYLSKQLGWPQHQVRVIVPEVGGGFGSKGNIYPEEALTAFATIKTGQPVKWIEDRSENLAVTTHGRGQIDYLEIAATREGKITGLKVRGFCDLGAYSQLTSALIMIAFGFPLSCGAYDIAKVHLSGDLVFTNKAPTDAYRGAGRPEATYVIERAMDLLARELNIDPAEIRRRNFIQPHQFPYQSAAGARYDSGNYAVALEKALQLVDYQNLRAEQARKRVAGKLMGIGLSSYVEACGVGPRGTAPFGLYESARVRIESSGTVLVYTGSSPHGQGGETTFAQIVSAEFGIPIDNIQVLHGDTDSTPEGRGTFGSRTTAVGGSALYMAVQRLKEKMKRIAASMLEASPSDITIQHGKFFVSGSPQKAINFAEIALAANFSNTLPADIEPGLETTTFWEPEASTVPFGTHVCVVEVDKETGTIAITRFVAVDDCGRQINPLLVEGQIHGGFAQGLGQALMESVSYSDDGQLLTATLMDYALPTATDFPNEIETASTFTLTQVNPLGVKGVGEAGTIGSIPAIANAVADALNVAHVDTPCTSEKLWQIIQRLPR